MENNVHKYYGLLLPNRENLSFQAARVNRQVKRNKLNFPVFDVKRTLPEERLPEFSLFLDLILYEFISKYFRISFRKLTSLLTEDHLPRVHQVLKRSIVIDRGDPHKS